MPYKLVGLEVTDRGIVREEAPIFAGEEKVGWSTSGTKPPTVGKAIALGFVSPEHAAEGTALTAEVRGKRLAVSVIPLPFYKRA